VILFWATSWANHPRGGQTPFTDRGGQWFRGRTNPDCRICVVLHHEMPAVWAFKLRTGISRTAYTQHGGFYHCMSLQWYNLRSYTLMLRDKRKTPRVSPPLCRELRR